MNLEWILMYCGTLKSSSQCRDILQTATSSYTFSWPESLSFNPYYLLFLSKFDILMGEKTNNAVTYCMLRQVIRFHGHSFQFLSYAHDLSTSSSSWNFIIVYWLTYWQEDKREMRHFTAKPFLGACQGNIWKNRASQVYSFFPYLTICW